LALKSVSLYPIIKNSKKRGEILNFEKISISEIRPFVRFSIHNSQLVHASYVVALEHRIFYVEDGEARFCVAGKAYTLQKNDVFYVSAGTPYKMEAYKDSNIYTLYFDLTMKNSDFLERIKPYGIQNIDNIPNCISDKYICNFRLVNGDDEITFIYSNENPTVLKWLNRIKAYIRDNTENEYTKNIVSGLMIVLLSKMLEYNNTYSKHKSSVQLANDVIEYIHKNYNKKITLDDISEEFNFNKTYLNRCVKSETGFSIFRYLLNYRMEQAMKLLMYSNMSVFEVAESVGFENTKSFSIAFKKFYSISPSKVSGIKSKNKKGVIYE